jgi:hypothetical protein
MFTSDPNAFATLAGQRGAHANLWRMIFWQRTFNYVSKNAPLAGIGMGPNITNLNRLTPAWPMFIPAMSVGLRNPHSAHLTIFARLGAIGLGLWCLILALTAWKSLEALWGHRIESVNPDVLDVDRALHRRAFFDILALFGVWLIYLTTMSLSVTLENPMGGIPFWALTGVLLRSTVRA